jgi:hypothetical protein
MLKRRKSRKKHLTDEVIAALKPERGKAYKVHDADPRTGIVLRVQPTGTKSLYLMYTFEGDHRQEHIGRWTPSNGLLRDARLRATVYKHDIESGIDPNPPPQKEESKTKKTITDYVPLFLKHGTRNAQGFGPRLRDVVVKRWGDREPHELPEGEFHDLLGAVVEEGKNPRARTLRDATRAFYNWLNERYRLRLHNPGNVGRKLAAELRKATNKYRVYTDEELAAVWNAAEEWPQLRLAMLTGVRSDTIPKIRWDWVNDDTFNLVEDPDAPQETRKRVPPMLPITAGIGRIFDECSRDGDLVFDPQPSNRDMNAKAGTEQHIKALKKTTATRLASLGVAQDVIDYLQGHSLAGSHARYNTHRYVEEARAALEQYERHLSPRSKCSRAATRATPARRSSCSSYLWADRRSWKYSRSWQSQPVTGQWRVPSC